MIEIVKTKKKNNTQCKQRKTNIFKHAKTNLRNKQKQHWGISHKQLNIFSQSINQKEKKNKFQK